MADPMYDAVFELAKAHLLQAFDRGCQTPPCGNGWKPGYEALLSCRSRIAPSVSSSIGEQIRFTEGFDTADLRDEKKLLDQSSPASA
jgi:hypothetical protein